MLAAGRAGEGLTRDRRDVVVFDDVLFGDALFGVLVFGILVFGASASIVAVFSADFAAAF